VSLHRHVRGEYNEPGQPGSDVITALSYGIVPSSHRNRLTDNIASRTRVEVISPLRNRLPISSALLKPEHLHAMVLSGRGSSDAKGADKEVHEYHASVINKRH